MFEIKNKIILSIIASAFVVSTSFANENLESRLNKLESMVDSLKEENKNLKSRLDKKDEIDEENLEIIDEVETRVDEIETKTLIDKINFSLGFKTRVESFEGEYANGSEYSQDNIWSSKFMLNMNSVVTDNLKFNGRLSMYKYWADSIPNQFTTMDSMQGRIPTDSKLYVERAYVDWKVMDGKVPMYITIGRQPSSDGPSHQFRNNTVRKSTYSALAFDGAADGVIGTINFEKLLGIKYSAIRFAYGKGFQNTNPRGFVGDDSDLDDTNFFGVFIDTSIPSIENSLIQFYGVSASDIIASNTDSNDLSNKNLGDYFVYGALVEFTNFLESGVDFFLQGAISKSSPNGQVYMADMNGDGTNESYGFLTSMPNDKNDKDGNAIWAGVRYTIPMWIKPKIGFEYNKGNKNWFSFTQGSTDLTNKLATRGDAFEVYYIHPINRFASLRVGATKINYDYTGSGWHIGMPMKIEKNNPYTSNQLDSLSNYYLMFNMLY